MLSGGSPKHGTTALFEKLRLLLSSSEEMNPPGCQEDCDISVTSLPKPNSDPPNLALGSNSSADELPETCSTVSLLTLAPVSPVPC